MNKTLKDALILFVITLIAGLALGGVYTITKEPIRKSKEEAALKAYQEVFAKAASFDEMTDIKDPLTAAYASEWKAKGYDKVFIDKVLVAKDSSQSDLGYVLLVTSHAGFGGDISFAMGITNEGIINGISILSISETPGLGMKAEDVLKPQFNNITATEFVVTKTGKVSENEIDAISGATITSKAVTGAVDAGVYYFTNELGGAK